MVKWGAENILLAQQVLSITEDMRKEENELKDLSGNIMNGRKKGPMWGEQYTG